MDSVSFQRFEAARLMAQAKMQSSQVSNRQNAINQAMSGLSNTGSTNSALGSTSGSARTPDLASLIEAKKKEMNQDLLSSISGKSRSNEIEEAPISGMFKNLGQNLGRMANQYLANQVSGMEPSSTPHQKILGNYVDVSV